MKRVGAAGSRLASCSSKPSNAEPAPDIASASVPSARPRMRFILRAPRRCPRTSRRTGSLALAASLAKSIASTASPRSSARGFTFSLGCVSIRIDFTPPFGGCAGFDSVPTIHQDSPLSFPVADTASSAPLGRVSNFKSSACAAPAQASDRISAARLARRAQGVVFFDRSTGDFPKIGEEASPCLALI